MEDGRQKGGNARWGDTFLVSPDGVEKVALLEPNTPGAFQESSPTLVIEDQPGLGDKKGQFRLWWRMFPAAAERKGNVTFWFRVEKGAFSVSLGRIDAALDMDNPSSFQLLARERIFLSLRATAFEPLFINLSKYRTANMEVLEPGKDYELSISWNLESDTPGFEVTLNGDPLERLDTGSQEPVAVARDAKDAAEGINAFALATKMGHDSAYALGPIHAKSGD